jgi:hypothetical protein
MRRYCRVRFKVMCNNRLIAALFFAPRIVMATRKPQI